MSKRSRESRSGPMHARGVGISFSAGARKELERKFGEAFVNRLGDTLSYLALGMRIREGMPRNTELRKQLKALREPVRALSGRAAQIIRACGASLSDPGTLLDAVERALAEVEPNRGGRPPDWAEKELAAAVFRLFIDFKKPIHTAQTSAFVRVIDACLAALRKAQGIKGPRSTDQARALARRSLPGK